MGAKHHRSTLTHGRHWIGNHIHHYRILPGECGRTRRISIALLHCNDRIVLQNNLYTLGGLPSWTPKIGTLPSSNTFYNNAVDKHTLILVGGIYCRNSDG